MLYFRRLTKSSNKPPFFTPSPNCHKLISSFKYQHIDVVYINLTTPEYDFRQRQTTNLYLLHLLCTASNLKKSWNSSKSRKFCLIYLVHFSNLKTVRSKRNTLCKTPKFHLTSLIGSFIETAISTAFWTILPKHCWNSAFSQNFHTWELV